MLSTSSTADAIFWTLTKTQRFSCFMSSYRSYSYASFLFYNVSNFPVMFLPYPEPASQSWNLCPVVLHDTSTYMQLHGWVNFSSTHWEDILSISIYDQLQCIKLTQLWTMINFFFLLHQLVIGKFPHEPRVWVEGEMLNATIVDAMGVFTTCYYDSLVPSELQMCHFHQIM